MKALVQKIKKLFIYQPRQGGVTDFKEIDKRREEAAMRYFYLCSRSL